MFSAFILAKVDFNMAPLWGGCGPGSMLGMGHWGIHGKHPGWERCETLKLGSIQVGDSIIGTILCVLSYFLVPVLLSTT